MKRILTGKLPAADIDKILPVFYVIQTFIAALTTVRHSVTITLQYFTIARYHQPSQPITKVEKTPCQPPVTVFNTQSSFDVPV